MDRVQDSCILHSARALRRKLLLSVLVSTGVFPTLSSYGKTKGINPFNEKRLLQQNKQIQKANYAPEDFPNFIREGNAYLYAFNAVMSHVISVLHAKMIILFSELNKKKNLLSFTLYLSCQCHRLTAVFNYLNLV